MTTHFNARWTIAGLNLLDVLHTLRDSDDEELQIQCDIFFDEKQEDDDALYEDNPQGVDLSSHVDVFNTVFKKVRGVWSSRAAHSFEGTEQWLQSYVWLTRSKYVFFPSLPTSVPIFVPRSPHASRSRFPSPLLSYLPHLLPTSLYLSLTRSVSLSPSTPSLPPLHPLPPLPPFLHPFLPPLFNRAQYLAACFRMEVSMRQSNHEISKYSSTVPSYMCFLSDAYKTPIVIHITFNTRTLRNQPQSFDRSRHYNIWRTKSLSPSVVYH